MEILKNNYKEPEPAKRQDDLREVKCHHCGSILKICPKDVHSGHIDFYNEVNQLERTYCSVVSCSCCGEDFEYYW